MVKAVFFDLYNTLVRYEPPQEELEAQALKDFGIEARPDTFRRPLVAANEFIYQEIARRPLSQRPREETMALYARYQEIVLTEAGIKAEPKLVYGLLGKMQQVKTKLALFDDALPALSGLKERGLVLGLISNIERDMTGTLNELGLAPRLDVVVTSLDAGAAKPNPAIFQAALQKAQVKPEEAIYVGDQYQVDVLGARGAGLKGILLDRYDYYGEIKDCPRIKSLKELVEHLES